MANLDSDFLISNLRERSRQGVRATGKPAGWLMPRVGGHGRLARGLALRSFDHFVHVCCVAKGVTRSDALIASLTGR